MTTPVITAPRFAGAIEIGQTYALQRNGWERFTVIGQCKTIRNLVGDTRHLVFTCEVGTEVGQMLFKPSDIVFEVKPYTTV